MLETMADKIYKNLKKDINNLIINSNEFLVEQEIAKKYGVSKAPVREAVHRLCQEGQLVSYPRKGYCIITINQEEFNQIQQLRYINESKALELFLRYRTKEDVKEIEKILKKEYNIDNNEKFHMSIAKLSQNKYLENIVFQLISKVSRTINIINNESHKKLDIICYHRNILEAIYENNLEKAQIFLKKDLRVNEE